MKYPTFKNSIVLFLVVTSPLFLYAQNLVFQDDELKSYLLQKSGVDLDGDNEISIEEAEQVTSLEIDDLSNEFHIASLNDLSGFPNLEWLNATHLDALDRVEGLGLQHLTYLFLGSNYSLSYVDVSDLPIVDTIYLSDLGDALDSLSIRNGGEHSFLSLFYTFNIEYACVDNFPSEFDFFQDAMMLGKEPTTACVSTPVEHLNEMNPIALFPNPTHGIVRWPDEIQVAKIVIFDIYGNELKQINNPKSLVNLMPYPAGCYFISIEIGDKEYHQKIIRN